MRILLANQFYGANSAATGQLLTDLALEMAARGMEVHVVCAKGSAEGHAAPDGPVTVHRVPAPQFQHGFAGRVLAYASFYAGAARLGFTLPRADLVVTLTTPPLLSLLGTALKMARGSRHAIWEMDVYPDVAVSLEVFEQGGLLDRLTGKLADASRHRADTVVALGECMKARLVGRGIAEQKIAVAENWADGRAITPVLRPQSAGPLALLYSGNLGLAHETETLAGAMRQLDRTGCFHWIFSGKGPRRRELEALCEREGLRSVEWRGYVERDSLGTSLGAGDIGLVTQRDNCCGSVVPSKVYGLLAAGRPVLFIGPDEATPARILRRFGCGWHLRCGDVDGLVALLRRLEGNREEVAAAGQRAREVLLEHYDRPLGVDRLCALLGVPRRAAAALARPLVEEVTVLPSEAVPAAYSGVLSDALEQRALVEVSN